MKKQEVLEIIKNELDLTSKVQAEEFIVGLNKVIDALEEKLESKKHKEDEADDTARLGRLTIKKVHVPERTGKSPLGGEWTKEAHDKIVCKVK